MQEFKLRFDFPSFLKISMLIGLCMGVGFAPIIIGLNLSQFGFGIIPTALLATPVLGVINGFAGGVIAYPIYYWISERVGFRFRGKLYVSTPEES